MNWQSLTIQLNHLTQRLPQRLLSRLLAVLLILLLGWLLAQLTWQLLPQPAVEHWQGEGQRTASATRSGTDLQRLLSFPLFGKASEQAEVRPEPVVTEAPKTRLNVKLTGLVSGRDPNLGSAVIESRGSELAYKVGEQIEGTNANLYQVLNDRVLLQVAGRFETLMLDGIEFTRIAEANVGLGRPDQDDEPQMISPQAEAPSLDQAEFAAQREAILAEPTRFFDFIRVTPQHNDGQLRGFRLMPGRDPGLFQRLGFRPNDLAVEINGIPLTDLQQANQVLGQLREASDASVRIERDGELIDIQFNLSQ
ncbi:type II secretion system protein GspC [Alkalimonas sp.]|uniref:type II secretion system protein GspC n=1 Tax=Alkalimonas sp. TaxID=1872453 RepID=UPI00263A6722|nr:type II secretion system protein GspC [Alkalimonas sp.]MCC5826838.1 type II secretion system protein GspC [Alkalimonas sp.]